VTSAAQPDDPRGARGRASAFVVGTGVVGGALIDLLAPRGARDDGGASSGRADDGAAGGAPPIRIVGVANRRALAIAAPAGEALSRRAIDAVAAAAPGGGATSIDDALLDRLAACPSPVLVDATADDRMEDLYVRAFARGVSVVTANKKPLVCAWPSRARLFAAMGARGARFGYEATVGAGMAVIETVRRLLREGDAVRRVDCVLSGTLAFLSRELGSGTKLSRAVAIARERGFTEPDPREDLRGTDVARKLTIVARELGAPFDVDDVALAPFVPEEALAAAGADGLAAALARLDGATAARVAELAARGEQLVYLARIDVDVDSGAIRASAGPAAVPAAHPAVAVAGSSAMAAFTTARHDREPLVLRRAGSGGRVTATAMIADVLRVVAPR